MNYGSDAMAQLLARENALYANEPVEIAKQNQAIAAASADVSAPIPSKYNEAVRAAESRLDQARRALALAETNARLKISREKPSEQLARLWFEQDTLSAIRDVQAAEAELNSAVQARVRRVEKKRHREAVEAAAPGRRAAAAERYQAELDAIDRDLMLARLGDQD